MYKDVSNWKWLLTPTRLALLRKDFNSRLIKWKLSVFGFHCIASTTASVGELCFCYSIVQTVHVMNNASINQSIKIHAVAMTLLAVATKRAKLLINATTSSDVENGEVGYA